MTERCIRCGSPEAKLTTIWGGVCYICRSCESDAEEIAEGIARLYLHGESDYFVGFRAKDIPELKRLFAQSESEDIRKLVEFLEAVEADIWPKEGKE